MTIQSRTVEYSTCGRPLAEGGRPTLFWYPAGANRRMLAGRMADLVRDAGLFVVLLLE